MNESWDFGLVISLDEVEESHLHYAQRVTYKDGKIYDIQFWPLPPGSHMSIDWNLIIELDIPMKVLDLREKRYMGIIVEKWEGSPVEECGR